MKISLTLLTLWLLLAIQPVSANSCRSISALQQEQLEVLQFSYQRGEEFGLGYTLAAIAWVESQAGLYPINIDDPSFGVYQVNIHTAIRRSDMKDTVLNRNLLATQLLEIDTGADYALQELLFWQDYRSNWRDVISSYNAGWNMENGRGYMVKVIDKVRLLTRCADNWMPEVHNVAMNDMTDQVSTGNQG